jgi:hypothetical protein
MVARSASGNFETEAQNALAATRFPGKRRLVEECEIVSICALRRFLGKKVILSSIRAAKSLRLDVSGGSFDLWFTYEAHWLPGKYSGYASLEDGTVRFWLVCPSCRKPVAKLFYFYLNPGFLDLSELLCRHCHQLTYQSANCGKNTWYKEKVRPLKRLLRARERISNWAGTARRDRLLRQIELKIVAFRSEYNQKRSRNHIGLNRRSGPHGRRPYRDMSLFF